MRLDFVAPALDEARLQIEIAIERSDVRAIAGPAADAHVAVHRVHVERARVERLNQQIAVDRGERQRRVGPAVVDRDAARDRLHGCKTGGAFEREVSADALHAHLALDVRHPDVARYRAQVDRRVSGNLDVELDLDAAPVAALAVLDAHLDAVARGIAFDERVRQALLRLFEHSAPTRASSPRPRSCPPRQG